MMPPIDAAPVGGGDPPKPPHGALDGEFISLSPLSADRFAELYAKTHGDAARESVWEFLPYGPFAGPDKMRDCYSAMANGGDPQFYAARHRADGAFAGIVSYLRINPAARSIEIGHIWHAVDRQRGRANSEAAFLLMDNAFSLGYRRLEWKCDALNMRSRRAALRLGLAFEGIFRQHLVVKGRNRDSAWFSLLDKDWPAAKSHFAAWFADNSLSLTALNKPLVAWSLPSHDAWR